MEGHQQWKASREGNHGKRFVSGYWFPDHSTWLKFRDQKAAAAASDTAQAPQDHKTGD